jgi:dihydrofolate synthase/folylpolyglutamate synthase
MRFSSLTQWLTWQERLHFTEIDPGLDRIGQVWQKMGGSSKLPFKVVTVAGTNGKGSTVATLAAILKAAGYRVGTYTSPHILRYNERICINEQPCEDATICEAFDRIDTTRESISLTYFEFATLAAADIFCREQVDLAIFEVGMGGRLDAVNLFDADISVITPIGLDHTQWLGDTREKIGREKAGIIRSGAPLVCSEAGVPVTVLEHAEVLKAPVSLAGRDFNYQSRYDSWSWRNSEKRLESLPLPSLKGVYQQQNSAAVIQVCWLLDKQGMTISEEAIRSGLSNIQLLGRFQVIPGDVTHILDVTHNTQGAENLANLLRTEFNTGRTFALMAMLRDKDCEDVVQLLAPVIDYWALAGLASERGQSGAELAARVQKQLKTGQFSHFSDITSAYSHLRTLAENGDKILIFGSFQTVESAVLLLEAETTLADSISVV